MHRRRSIVRRWAVISEHTNGHNRYANQDGSSQIYQPGFPKIAVDGLIRVAQWRYQLVHGNSEVVGKYSGQHSFFNIFVACFCRRWYKATAHREPTIRIPHIRNSLRLQVGADP
jgi:hypothetical protein